MKKETKDEIKEVIKSVLQTKFDKDTAETESKPFFEAIFSKEHILVGSILQSMYTSFGMSVYEQIGVILAKSAGFEAERQYILRGEIDASTENWINKHWKELKNSIKNKKTDLDTAKAKDSEIKKIREIIKPCSINLDELEKDGDSTVDLYIRNPKDGSEYYIDITTVKNNLKGFEVLKLKMLRWVALRCSVKKDAKVNTYIGIPYNPYNPEPYLRWNATILDSKNDILVQEDLWNLIGNDPNTYNDLLEIFKEVGDELKQEIQDFFDSKK